jgi:hypothetical protein
MVMDEFLTSSPDCQTIVPLISNTTVLTPVASIAALSEPVPASFRFVTLMTLPPRPPLAALPNPSALGNAFTSTLSVSGSSPSIGPPLSRASAGALSLKSQLGKKQRLKKALITNRGTPDGSFDFKRGQACLSKGLDPNTTFPRKSLKTPLLSCSARILPKIPNHKEILPALPPQVHLTFAIEAILASQISNWPPPL